jgi:ubiquinone/menaquinone biosynthesis C-methylase UbiE
MTTTTRRVDYDQVAPLYDEPSRDFGPDPDLLRFLKLRPAAGLSSLRILDTGCGTGKQLAANRLKLPDLPMVGLDLFHGMLEQARKRCPAVDWVQGDGSRLPFPDRSFDYITNQFSYPHVPDKPALFSEIYRLLKPGGRFVIMNIDPFAMTDWIIYRYFPASKTRDFADFLPEDRLVPLLTQCGLRRIRVRRKLARSEQTLDDFLAYASRRYRTSQFMAIDDQDYAGGLSRLQADIRRLGGEALVPTDLCLIWFTANKPA